MIGLTSEITDKVSLADGTIVYIPLSTDEASVIK